MTRRRLLVTGGSGYLGGRVVDRARDGWQVTATHFSRPGDAPGVSWHPLDVRDEAAVDALVAEAKPDVIVHTAVIDLRFKNIDAEIRSGAYGVGTLACGQ